MRVQLTPRAAAASAAAPLPPLSPSGLVAAPHYQVQGHGEWGSSGDAELGGLRRTTSLASSSHGGVTAIKDWYGKRTAVAKATSKDVVPIKPKHLNRLVQASWRALYQPGGEETIFVHLIKRPIHTSAVVALKVLAVLHRLLQQGSPEFPAALHGNISLLRNMHNTWKGRAEAAAWAVGGGIGGGSSVEGESAEYAPLVAPYTQLLILKTLFHFDWRMFENNYSLRGGNMELGQRSSMGRNPVSVQAVNTLQKLLEQVLLTLDAAFAILRAPPPGSLNGVATSSAPEATNFKAFLCIGLLREADLLYDILCYILSSLAQSSSSPQELRWFIAKFDSQYASLRAAYEKAWAEPAVCSEVSPPRLPSTPPHFFARVAGGAGAAQEEGIMRAPPSYREPHFIHGDNNDDDDDEDLGGSATPSSTGSCVDMRLPWPTHPPASLTGPGASSMRHLATSMPYSAVAGPYGRSQSARTELSSALDDSFGSGGPASALSTHNNTPTMAQMHAGGGGGSTSMHGTVLSGGSTQLLHDPECSFGSSGSGIQLQSGQAGARVGSGLGAMGLGGVTSGGTQLAPLASLATMVVSSSPGDMRSHVSSGSLSDVASPSSTFLSSSGTFSQLADVTTQAFVTSGGATGPSTPAPATVTTTATVAGWVKLDDDSSPPLPPPLLAGLPYARSASYHHPPGSATAGSLAASTWGDARDVSALSTPSTPNAPTSQYRGRYGRSVSGGDAVWAGMAPGKGMAMGGDAAVGPLGTMVGVGGMLRTMGSPSSSHPPPPPPAQALGPSQQPQALQPPQTALAPPIAPPPGVQPLGPTTPGVGQLPLGFASSSAPALAVVVAQQQQAHMRSVSASAAEPFGGPDASSNLFGSAGELGGGGGNSGNPFAGGSTKHRPWQSNGGAHDLLATAGLKEPPKQGCDANQFADLLQSLSVDGVVASASSSGGLVTGGTAPAASSQSQQQVVGGVTAASSGAGPGLSLLAGAQGGVRQQQLIGAQRTSISSGGSGNGPALAMAKPRVTLQQNNSGSLVELAAAVVVVGSPGKDPSSLDVPRPAVTGAPAASTGWGFMEQPAALSRGGADRHGRRVSVDDWDPSAKLPAGGGGAGSGLPQPQPNPQQYSTAPHQHKQQHGFGDLAGRGPTMIPAGAVSGPFRPESMATVTDAGERGWGGGYGEDGLDDVAMSEIEIPISEIKFGQKIGQGAFGDVVRGEWKGTAVAVKRLTNVTAASSKSSAVRDFRREVSMLYKVRHPNVVLFMGACTVPPDLCIVMEEYANGSLFSVLHRKSFRIDMATVVRWATEIARGMVHLHTRSPPIVHRDLKSVNLLLDDNWHIKVSDFGLARTKANSYAYTQVGTWGWMAPEVLDNAPYNEKADVYSFGVVLWELITREEPFKGMHPMQIMRAIDRGERPPIPEGTLPEYKQLVNDAWHTEPRCRPTFEQSKVVQDLKEL
eukprot:jgi/Mesvir1/907/Mv17468-RA.1